MGEAICTPKAGTVTELTLWEEYVLEIWALGGNSSLKMGFKGTDVPEKGAGLKGCLRHVGKKGDRLRTSPGRVTHGRHEMTDHCSLASRARKVCPGQGRGTGQMAQLKADAGEGPLATASLSRWGTETQGV